MKVIFLDIDGVLNPMGDYDPEKEWFKIKGYKCPPLKDLSPEDDALLLSLIYRFKPECVNLLNQVTDKTKAKLVISSAWRKGRELDFFAGKGLTGEIIDKTPVIDGANKGDEIQAWLDLHPECTKFVIVDDDNDMGHLMQHLVQTNYAIGITKKTVKDLIQHLQA